MWSMLYNFCTFSYPLAFKFRPEIFPAQCHCHLKIDTIRMNPFFRLAYNRFTGYMACEVKHSQAFVF